MYIPAKEKFRRGEIKRVLRPLLSLRRREGWVTAFWGVSWPMPKMKKTKKRKQKVFHRLLCILSAQKRKERDLSPCPYRTWRRGGMFADAFSRWGRGRPHLRLAETIRRAKTRGKKGRRLRVLVIGERGGGRRKTSLQEGHHFLGKGKDGRSLQSS